MEKEMSRYELQAEVTNINNKLEGVKPTATAPYYVELRTRLQELLQIAKDRGQVVYSPISTRGEA